MTKIHPERSGTLARRRTRTYASRTPEGEDECPGEDAGARPEEREERREPAEHAARDDSVTRAVHNPVSPSPAGEPDRNPSKGPF